MPLKMKSYISFLNSFSKYQDLVLAIFFFMAVMMMIIPLPTIVVDIIIAINISTALLLLMLSIYIKRPLDLSVFPTILLITTLMRLSLSVSTTRLILLQHDAGEIIYSFGNFVVGGNIVVGLIIFVIITIVQFLVITKGAERVAEVGARFSLDGMPGKQMSIDGDMRAGIIDAQEAKKQRAEVQKESQLYGAMDGAMKFVKGDAIASIIIIVVNLLGGVLIGMWQFNMSFSDALALFSVLSVGDALVAQIPALLISVTAGIVVTRVPGEINNNLAGDIIGQVSGNSRPFFISAGLMLVMASIPGFPVLVFILLSLAMGVIGWRVNKKQVFDSHSSLGPEERIGSENVTSGAVPLRLKIGARIFNAELKQFIDMMRWRFFDERGIPLPEIVLECSSIKDDAIEVYLYQELVYKTFWENEKIIFFPNSNDFSFEYQKELLPYGRKVYKTPLANEEIAISLGIKVVNNVNDAVVFYSKLIVSCCAREFIGVQETRYLMDIMERQYSELVKELQRQLGLSKIVDILQRLVDEEISIRDLRTIFETLILWSVKEKDVVILCEYVRVALRRHIISKHSNHGEMLSVWLIGSELENEMREAIRQTSSGSYLNLSAERSSQLIASMNTIIDSNINGVILTSLDIRRYMKKLIEGTIPTISVLSFQEVGNDIGLKVLGTINGYE
ncbi:regulatory protein [Edwardsiella piscicida]|nr:SsaV [Edwardsiella sp. EA181011]GAJ68499.1 regulatory protein [Edwardsiella piscicida]